LADSVQAVIVNEEQQVLLIKRKGYNDDKFLWRLVKGRRKPEERDEEALKREIREETGLERFDIVKKIYVYSYATSENVVKVNTYLVFAEKNQKLMNLDNEEQIVDYKWVDFEKAKNMLFFKEEIDAVEKAKKELNHAPLL